jgi:hypothetical protein
MTSMTKTTQTKSPAMKVCICGCGQTFPARGGKKYASEACRNSPQLLVNLQSVLAPTGEVTCLTWAVAGNRWLARITGLRHDDQYQHPFMLEWVRSANGVFPITQPGVYFFGSTGGGQREYRLVRADFTVEPFTKAKVVKLFEVTDKAIQVWSEPLGEFLWVLGDAAGYEARTLVETAPGVKAWE